MLFLIAPRPQNMESPSKADAQKVMEGPETQSENCGLADPEHIQLTHRTNVDESVAEVVTDKVGTPGCMKRLRSHWKLIVIIILNGLFFTMTIIVIIMVINQQSLTSELHKLTKEITKERNSVTHLRKLFNSTLQNFTKMEKEYDKMSQVLNSTLYNSSIIAAENVQLRKLLNGTLQEKMQLQEENKALDVLLNSTLENCTLIEMENQLLNIVLNKSLSIIALASAENKKLHSMLNTERQINTQLTTINQRQSSILSANKLSFLWTLCNNVTMQCVSCPHGWVEHASRCYLLSEDQKKWEDARRTCLDNNADLAVVTSEEEQAFLTNMTYQYVKKHPDRYFHSAWIGLQDMVKEGIHFWITGERIKWDVSYWMDMEPNNAIASWDTDGAGQDCVAIVPPKAIGTEDWLNSWDDIVCGGKRHYLCETKALVFS
ncbi:uncharacterized protein ACNS7B_024311 isoform 2-T2 [Menidia menidia]